jgi:hypothetical protein
VRLKATNRNLFAEKPTAYLGPVLPQDRRHIVGKDDVVFGIALAEFILNLLGQIILFILGFPIANRHADLHRQRAINGDQIALIGAALIFLAKDQIMLFAPRAEQSSERGPQVRLTFAAG